MRFWYCFIYCCFVGTASFFLGRLLPKSWLNPYAFPFAAFDFEENGKLYEKLGMRYWQKRLPDMSRIFVRLMPPKKITADVKDRLPDMILETCVAETVHFGNSLMGLFCLQLWPGVGGLICALLFAAVFNVPFIFIQRYNRPRLIRLARRMGVAEQKEAEAALPTH